MILGKSELIIKTFASLILALSWLVIPVAGATDVSSLIGPEFLISQGNPGFGFAPRATSNGTNFLVAWCNESSNRVHCARVNLDQTVETNSFSITSDFGWVSVSSDGKDYLLVFSDINTIKAVRIPGAGPITNSAITVYEDATTLPSVPAVASDGTNWLIAFANWPTNSAPIGISAITLTHDMLPGAAFQISEGEDLLPELGFNGTSYLCAWRRGWDESLLAARISERGIVLDTNSIVVDQTRAYRDTIRVVSNGDEFLIVWRNVPYQEEIRGARMSAKGEVLNPGGMLLVPPPYVSEADVCYNGYEYIVLHDTYTEGSPSPFARGVFLSPTSQTLAEFSLDQGYNRRRAIASDANGRMLFVVDTSTDIRGRFIHPPPNAVNLLFTNQQAVLSWRSIAGRSYQVERKPRFSATNWSIATGIILATNSITTTSFATNEQPRSFYRIRQLP